MADNIITNANDVELLLEQSGADTKGTSRQYGRIVVDDFSITREQDISSQSGVGRYLPAGLSKGDVELSFSFTMMGQDVDVFEMISEDDGVSIPFDFAAKKTDGQDTEWQYKLVTCLASSEEISASSGDAMEYAVEGMAVRLDKDISAN